MNKLVIDNSVLVKLFVDEDEGEKVDDILRYLSRGKLEIFCPEFLLIEMINVLLVSKKLKKEQVIKVIKRLKSMKIVFEEFDGDCVELVNLCSKFVLTAYDAVYLELAMKKKCKLLTADKQLLKIKKYCVCLADFKV